MVDYSVFNIKNIPAALWGEKSDKLFIAIHGDMSNKLDSVIRIFAEEAVPLNYQVLSFDLPEHGSRKNESYLCTVQNCIKDILAIITYSKANFKEINIFACSIGVYFSLLSFKNEKVNQSLFLSPVLDMEKLINNMMKLFDITEKELETKKEIKTPIGKTLYWDYYSYVKTHPITYWNSNTKILYGEKDNLVEFDTILNFSKDFNSNLTVMENGEHFFHTDEQLNYYKQWLKNNIE